MKTQWRIVILVAAVAIASCSPEKKLQEKAQKLAKEYIIIDGHVDVPYKIQEHFRDISVFDSAMNFDYVKAKDGGIDAPFMSIYVSSKFQAEGEGASKNQGGAFEQAKKLIELTKTIVSGNPDKFALAFTPADIRLNFDKGLISMPMGMENGAPIEGDLEKLRFLFKQGIRYVTLTHGQWNHICDSSYDVERHWGGLSPFGKEAVLEMNRLGVFVDVSHVSDSTFYQVIRLSKAPVIASHSSARFFTPGKERNMSDDMIRTLAKKGGIIMINFGSGFLTREAAEFSTFVSDSIKKVLGVTRFAEVDVDTLFAMFRQVRKLYPYPHAHLSDVANHIDHVVKLVGVDYVGFGSDFDGVGDSLPVGLKDVSGYPNLIAELLKRGYSDEDIKKICGENLLRTWEEIIAVSEHLQTRQQDIPDHL